MSTSEEMLTDEEFNRLFNEAQYAFDDGELFFRKAKHGYSFIRSDS